MFMVFQGYQRTLDLINVQKFGRKNQGNKKVLKVEKRSM
jgi:hypothetical protein